MCLRQCFLFGTIVALTVISKIRTAASVAFKSFAAFGQEASVAVQANIWSQWNSSLAAKFTCP